MPWTKYYDYGDSIAKKYRIAKGKPQKRDVLGKKAELNLLMSRMKPLEPKKRRRR